MKGSHLVGYAQSKGVPSPKLAIFVSGLLLLIGGVSMVLGLYPVIGVIALVVFLIPVSFKMHAYWKIQDPMGRMSEQVAFRKNMGLLGAALMMLAIATPWMYSL